MVKPKSHYVSLQNSKDWREKRMPTKAWTKLIEWQMYAVSIYILTRITVF